MAFDTSALTAWVDEKREKGDFVMKPILAAMTIQKLTGIDKRFGLKGHTEKIPTFETTTPWQAASCGFTSEGSTTIDQISLTTVGIQVAEEICLDDLNTFAFQNSVNKTGLDETFGLMDMWTGRKMQQMALQIESALWQGDKDQVVYSTHLKRFDGFIKIIDAAGDEIAATATGGITISTVRGIIEEIAYDKIPSKIRGEGAVIVCGLDTFNIYRKKLMIDNLFAHDPNNTDLSGYSMNVFGTNVKLMGLAGLNNDTAMDAGNLETSVKNRVFAMRESNLLVGMNAQNDTETWDVWYDKNTRLLKFFAKFHLGVGVKYTDEVVSYENS